jgi:hypothetical protein
MPTAIGQGSMRVIAAGVAVAAYSVFFSTPLRLMPISWPF